MDAIVIREEAGSHTMQYDASEGQCGMEWGHLCGEIDSSPHYNGSGEEPLHSPAQETCAENLLLVYAFF